MGRFRIREMMTAPIEKKKGGGDWRILAVILLVVIICIAVGGRAAWQILY